MFLGAAGGLHEGEDLDVDDVGEGAFRGLGDGAGADRAAAGNVVRPPLGLADRVDEIPTLVPGLEVGVAVIVAEVVCVDTRAGAEEDLENVPFAAEERASERGVAEVVCTFQIRARRD